MANYRFKLKQFIKNIDNINHVLEEKNISIKKLSKIVHINRRTLNRILKKKICFTFYNIIDIEKKLNRYLEENYENDLNIVFNKCKLKKFKEIGLYKNLLSLNFYFNRYLQAIIFALSIFDKIKNYYLFFKLTLPIYPDNILTFDNAIELLIKNKIILIDNNDMKRGKNFIKCDLNNKMKTRLLNSFIEYFRKNKNYNYLFYLILINESLSNIEREAFLMEIIFEKTFAGDFVYVKKIFNDYFSYLKYHNKKKSKYFKLFYFVVNISIQTLNLFTVKSLLLFEYVLKHFPIKNNVFEINNNEFDFKIIDNYFNKYKQFKVYPLYFIYDSFLSLSYTYFKLEMYPQFFSFSEYVISNLKEDNYFRSYFIGYLYLFFLKYGNLDYLDFLIDLIKKFKDKSQNEIYLKLIQSKYILLKNNKMIKNINKEYLILFEKNKLNYTYLNNFNERYINSLIVTKRYKKAIAYSFLLMINNKIDRNLYEGILFFYLIFIVLLKDKDIANKEYYIFDIQFKYILLEINSDPFNKILCEIDSNGNINTKEIIKKCKDIVFINSNNYRKNNIDNNYINKILNMKLKEIFQIVFSLSKKVFKNLEKEIKIGFEKFTRCKYDTILEITNYLIENGKIEKKLVDFDTLGKMKIDIISQYLKYCKTGFINRLSSSDNKFFGKIKYQQEYLFYINFFYKIYNNIYKKNIKYNILKNSNLIKNSNFDNIINILFEKNNLKIVNNHFFDLSSFISEYFFNYLKSLSEKRNLILKDLEKKETNISLKNKYIFIGKNIYKKKKKLNITEEYLKLYDNLPLYPFLSYYKAKIIE